MPSYTQILVHFVFATKHRNRVLTEDRRRDFLGYAVGIAQGMRCHVYQINCVEDHLHMLVDLHPTVSISDFVKRFKLSSGNWIRTNNVFPSFDQWQEKYSAFSIGWSGRKSVIQYIRNQQEHHRTVTFEEELRQIVEEAGLKWDDVYKDG